MFFRYPLKVLSHMIKKPEDRQYLTKRGLKMSKKHGCFGGLLGGGNNSVVLIILILVIFALIDNDNDED